MELNTRILAFPSSSLICAFAKYVELLSRTGTRHRRLSSQSALKIKYMVAQSTPHALHRLATSRKSLDATRMVSSGHEHLGESSIGRVEVVSTNLTNVAPYMFLMAAFKRTLLQMIMQYLHACARVCDCRSGIREASTRTTTQALGVTKTPFRNQILWVFCAFSFSQRASFPESLPPKQKHEQGCIWLNTHLHSVLYCD